jgi:hypothetical protein
VVIYVDGKFVFETLDSGTFEVGAFDNEHGIVIPVESLDIPNGIRPRQAAIRRGYLAADNDLGRLSQRTQQPA